MKPKIVIVGAGSLFFGRKLIWAMNHLEGLTEGHLALVDTDPQHLSAMEALARKAKSASGAKFQISATTRYEEALPDADFVVLSFSHRNAHYRGVDVQISAKHGIRMCSGDTIGPGGIFRALREFPKVMEIAKATETLCPNAWLINYINPSSVFGIALSKVCKTRNFALCDSLHLPFLHHQYMKMIGLDPSDEKDFSMRIAGVNHFTWLIESNFRGENVLPRIHDAMRSIGEDEDPKANAKALFNMRIAAHLGDVFGALPVCTAHTKEYLPYFQGHGLHLEDEHVGPLKLFEHDQRKGITEAMWKEIAEYTDGSLPIETFSQNYTSDHATDIIQAIWNDSGRHFFINLPNNGTVSNLPDETFLELECVLDRNGPKPISTPDMPLGLRGLQMQIHDTHALTVEAFLQKDRGLLIRALATDPLTASLTSAEAALDELYAAQCDVLEPWVGQKKQPITMPKESFSPAVQQGQTNEGKN